MLYRLLALVFAAQALCGCANMMAVHYTRAMPQNRILGIDSDQRTIITGDFNDSRAICAEPSPDTTSVLAAAASANLTRRELGELQASLALSESSMTIGLRTPTIQLLRDGMYRLCETYMNGGISREMYVVLINRYQEMMVGLVAIEQLTGVAQAPAMAIRAGAANTSAKANLLSQARADLVRYDSELRQAESELQRLNGTAVPDNDQRKAERDTQIANLAWRRDNLRAALAAQQTVVQALQQANDTETAASVAGGATDVGARTAVTAPTTEIANAVRDITARMTRGNYVMMACLPVLLRETPTESSAAAVRPSPTAPNLLEASNTNIAFCRTMMERLVTESSR